MSDTRPILRLEDKDGDEVRFWLNADGDLRVYSDEWFVSGASDSARSMGWPVNEDDAADCGTTLASIRDQLLEMEKAQ